MPNYAPSLLSGARSLLEPATIAAAQAELAKRNLADFVRLAWPLAGTTEPLVWGPHLDAICQHLQAVEEGLIRKLVISIAPGHAKSKVVSVLWPAWVWTRRPEEQFLCASYAHALAERDSVYCRGLIESEWYQESFMHGWTLKPDQNAKGFYANTREGHRVSVGVGGTGLRAGRIVIDDPLSAVDALSEAARNEANRWIGQTLTTRFNDQATGGAVLIMQRLHEDDPTAFVLAGGGWEHLRLPTEFEPNEPSVTYATRDTPANGIPAHRERYEFWRDWRHEEGELLFPEKFPRAIIEELKRPNALGVDGFASQHQQRPTPAAGGMFKKADWRFWKAPSDTDRTLFRPRGCDKGAAVDLPAMERVIISVDATFRKTTHGSYVAIHVWGKCKAGRFLLDRVHERLDFDGTVQALLGVIRRWPDAREKVIEAKANGDAIMNTLANTHGVAGIVPENPGSANKEQRAFAMLPYQRAGNVYLPDGAPWLGEYIEEHAAFPLGRHDDDVDAQSQALRHLEREKTTMEKMADVEW